MVIATSSRFLDGHDFKHDDHDATMDHDEVVLECHRVIVTIVIIVPIAVPSTLCCDRLTQVRI